MIDLKELKRLAEGARNHKSMIHAQDIKENKHISQTYRVIESYSDSYEQFAELYTKEDAEYFIAANPSTILQLIKEHQEMREALESIASKNKPRHDDAKYWQAISREQCAEVLANDTRIARQTLEGVSK